MISLRPSSNWRHLFALSLAAWLVACGSVGEPLPPLLHIPGRVDDFAVRQTASELVAEWTWPVLGSEGQVFRDMERFEIYSLFVPPGNDPPPAEALSEHGQIVTTVAAQEPATTGPGTRLVARAPLAGHYGVRRGFAVRGVSATGRVSAWSDLRVLDVVQPPAAAADLVGMTVEQGVSLVWTPVEDAVRYDVERRIADGEFVVIGVAEASEFLDASPQWETPSAYRVKALKSVDDSPDVPGLASNIAALTPRDEFPPATPSALRALAVDSGVELSWASNAEPDLAGYRVLRDGAQVHEGLLESANFSDQPLLPGQTVVYRVAAVDRSGNASSPAEVQAVSPR